MRLREYVMVVVFLAVQIAIAEEMRIWTSASGKTLEATFVEQKFDQVILRSPAGEMIKIRLNQLSSADQIYVGNLKIASPGLPAAGAKSAAESKPIPPALEELLGRRLEGVKGKRMSPADLAGKKIGIYFSASWCPPCRAFTPELVKAYNQLRTDGKPFEVVLVTSDQTEAAMEKYMKSHEMPWVAVPFGDKHIEVLKKKFAVTGIPKLVVIDDAGKTLSANARSEVMAKGAAAFDDW